MTYNVFSGMLSITESISHILAVELWTVIVWLIKSMSENDDADSADQNV